MDPEASGADYLRRLKDGQSGGTSQTVSPATSSTVTSEAPAGGERRRSPRYQCQGSAKFRPVGSEVHSWGSFTDVSVNGCYVEVTATYPVGSRLELELEVNGNRAEVVGEVRISYPFLGMGIAFREVSDENRQRLAQMVRSLAHSTRVVGGSASASSLKPGAQEEARAAESRDPRRALEVLFEHFDKHSALTREEFYRLLRDSQPAR